MTKHAIPQDSDARKLFPMVSGLLDYFPSALAAVAEHSHYANEKHNPGEPMHWSRGKSTDHADCIMRHLIERGGYDNEKRRHSAALAWRALALLQEELEAEGWAPGRGSRFPETKNPATSDEVGYEATPKEIAELAKAVRRATKQARPKPARKRK